jgi:predicted AAA+ superfamily ATPase
LRPYSNRLARTIRKDRRAFFFDCAAAYDDTSGAQLENLVACSLLKFVDFRKDAVGESWDLFYLRDKEQREIDFVVTLNRRIHWLIEVKRTDGALSPSLKYYTERLQPRASLQLVLQLDRAQEKAGVKIVPLAEWLDALPFD